MAKIKTLYNYGDSVKVISGRYKDRTGTIIQVFPEPVIDPKETIYTVKFDKSHNVGLFKESEITNK